MKLRFVTQHARLIVMSCLICMVSLPAQAERRLFGGLYLIDGEHPVPNITVFLEGAHGSSDVTTDLGQFALFLPDMYQADALVILKIKSATYQIFHPVAGRVRIPVNLQTSSIKVLVDKLGSHRFLSREAFALLIENIAEKAKAEVKTGTERQELDLSRYLKEWAVQYGFGLEEVEAELDTWAAEIEEKQEDLYELGLAAFYKKNFQEAAEKFTQSAKYHEAQLAAAREQARELQTKVIRDYRLAGDAHHQDYQFQEALKAYQKALAEIQKEDNPQEWASLTNDIGNTYWSLGERVGGEAARQCLDNAVAAYRAALEIYTREALPHRWAATQTNLGNALQSQGERTDGAAGTRLLAEAVTAYRESLTVRTREALPLAWARTQNNLGNALQTQGKRAGGNDGLQLLAEAVAAHRAALTVRTREAMPQEWAMTQMNLGISLQYLGESMDKTTGKPLLKAAEAAFRAALTVYTPKTLPQHWARAQMNLGTSLLRQGARAGGAAGQALLAEAVAAYRLALTIYTHEVLPQDWAGTQINLGSALREQALMSTNKEEQRSLLQEAVAVLNLSLEVFTYEHFPPQWATIQQNLAKTYSFLEDWQNAAECYTNVLRVYPDDEIAFQASSFLYHERLFQFEKAYALNTKWVYELGHDDSYSMSNYLEIHVTTAHFAEADNIFTSLMMKLSPEHRLYIPICAIEIVNLLALHQVEEVPASLDKFINALQQQPEDYTLDWSFLGMKYFISTSEDLASHRDWLLSLFAVLEEPDRDAILLRLPSLRDSFRP